MWLSVSSKQTSVSFVTTVSVSICYVLLKTENYANLWNSTWWFINVPLMIIHMLEVHQMVLKTNMCSLMVFVLSGKPLLKTYRVLLECMTFRWIQHCNMVILQQYILVWQSVGDPPSCLKSTVLLSSSSSSSMNITGSYQDYIQKYRRHF